MDNLHSILYVGAWDDISVINDYPNCVEYIFIDTQPRRESERSIEYDEHLYRHHFIENIITKFGKEGFFIKDSYSIDENYYTHCMTKTQIENGVPLYVNPTVLYFENPISKTFIKYYVSTNIKYNMCNELKNDIGMCDGFITAGCFPNKEYLDYFQKPKIFLAYSGTVYSECMKSYAQYPPTRQCFYNNVLSYLKKMPENDFRKDYKLSNFLPFSWFHKTSEENAFSKYFTKGYFMQSESYKIYFDIKPKEFNNAEELIYISNKFFDIWRKQNDSDSEPEPENKTEDKPNTIAQDCNCIVS
jgi:hypothetical protein